MKKLLIDTLTAPWAFAEDKTLSPWMKTFLWAIILLCAAAVAYALTFPAHAQGMCGECLSPNCRMMMCPDGEGDSRPWYCRYGYAHCDREGNIMRYHTPDSPYRQGPPHRNRYGYDD